MHTQALAAAERGRVLGSPNLIVRRGDHRGQPGDPDVANASVSTEVSGRVLPVSMKERSKSRPVSARVGGLRRMDPRWGGC
jgi:hypothetical protein